MKKLFLLLLLAFFALGLIACKDKDDPYVTGTLMQELERLNDFDNHTITMYFDTEFGDIELVVKYDGEYVYIVDFMNSPFEDDSYIDPIEAGVKDDYGDAALEAMLFWVQGAVFGHAFFLNPFLMMMDYDVMPLLDPTMYDVDDNVFALKQTAYEDFALAMFIFQVLVDSLVFNMMEDLEDQLDAWFDDKDVDFPGMDPNDLHDAFRDVFDIEWANIEDTLILHTITVREDALELYLDIDIDGFTFDITVTFHDYDNTVVDYENDISFFVMFEDIMIKMPVIYQITMVNMAAGLYCNDPLNVCAIDDILTVSDLENDIVTVETWIEDYTVDGVFLVEVYYYDAVEEKLHFRVAYEVEIDDITYRFCGNVDLLDGGDVALWILKEGDDGFDDAAIDFITPALPDDTNPDA